MYKNLPKFNDNSYAHFVTTRTYENRPYFKNGELSDILLKEIGFYSEKYGFEVLGWVIMPDHVHLLLWWDKEEKPTLTVSKIMQGIKAGTAMRIIGYFKNKGLEHLLQPTHKRDDGSEWVPQITHREGRLEGSQGEERLQRTHKRAMAWSRCSKLPVKTMSKRIHWEKGCSKLPKGEKLIPSHTNEILSITCGSRDSTISISTVRRSC